MLDETDKGKKLTPGEHLRKEMKRRGYDQKSLAEELGISRQMLNYYVNDKYPISAKHGAVIADFMGLPRGYWLEDDFADRPAAEQALPFDPRPHADGGVLCDHEIEQAIRDREISIHPYTSENVKQASLDLTAGTDLILSDGEEIEMRRDMGFCLEPGQMAVVLTEETIFLKNQMIARVGGTTNYTRQGLIVHHGLHVDPAFSGKLQITVQYIGTGHFELYRGMTLLSLEFSRLSTAPMRDFLQEKESFTTTAELLRKQQVSSDR